MATTKRNLNLKQQEAWDIICAFADRTWIEVQIIMDYQLRIKSETIMMDIYPKNKKYAIWENNHKRPAWKSYKGLNLEKLLISKFGE